MKELFIDFKQCKTLDPNIFTVITGEKWANDEKQHYVNKPENLFFSEDGLVLRATHPKNNIYESIRINTKGKFSFTYGEIEIVAKVPKGIGTWPALWMMSEDNRYGHWPKSGEIDIMEHVGRDKDNLFLCLHCEAYNHTRKSQRYKEFKVKNATDEFVAYGLKWDKDEITYFVNGKEAVKYSKYDLPDQTEKGWPFDHNYYLIMNLAIGGKFGGPIDNSMFPQDFIIQSIKINY